MAIPTTVAIGPVPTLRIIGAVNAVGEMIVVYGEVIFNVNFVASPRRGTPSRRVWRGELARPPSTSGLSPVETAFELVCV